MLFRKQLVGFLIVSALSAALGAGVTALVLKPAAAPQQCDPNHVAGHVSTDIKSTKYARANTVTLHFDKLILSCVDKVELIGKVKNEANRVLVSNMIIDGYLNSNSNYSVMAKITTHNFDPTVIHVASLVVCPTIEGYAFRLHYGDAQVDYPFEVSYAPLLTGSKHETCESLEVKGEKNR